jgi:hypothetical protein
MVMVKFTLEQSKKAQSGSRCIATFSFTSALDGGGLSTSHPGRLTPGKVPGTIIRGWVGPRAFQDWCGKYCLHRDSILGTTNPYRFTVPATPFRPAQDVKGQIYHTIFLRQLYFINISIYATVLSSTLEIVNLLATETPVYQIPAREHSIWE